MTLPSPDGDLTKTSSPARVEPVTKPETPQIAFEDLAKGHRIVQIVHGESVYELRLTRNGRLVLCK